MRVTRRRWAGFRWFLLAVTVAMLSSITLLPVAAVDGPWFPEDELQPPGTADNNRWGTSVDIDGVTLVAGALNDQSVHVFTLNPGSGSWDHAQELTDPSAEPQDDFGVSVAIDDGWIVVGAQRDDGAGSNRGAVHVFKQNPSTDVWSHEQELSDPNTTDHDWVGTSVAIEGNTIVAGARLDDGSAPNPEQGAAHVFSRDPSTDVWSHHQELTDPNAAANDWFGYSVAISGDHIAVGGYGDDGQSGSDRGAVHAFSRNPSTGSWSHDQELTDPNASDGDELGWSVAIQGDWIVGGADRDGRLGTVAGAAHMFSRNPSTGVWGHHQELSDPDGRGGEFFGASVSIAGDWVMVGAPLDTVTDTPTTSYGAAHAFTYNPGTTMWDHVQQIADLHRSETDEFGRSVAIDAVRIVVGAPGDDHATGDAHANRGAVHVFQADTSAPSVSITSPADEAVFDLGDAITADFSCSDSGSGIASCIGTVPNGGLLDTSSAGPHDFSVTATDNVGNETTLTHTYTVNAPPHADDAAISVSISSDAHVFGFGWLVGTVVTVTVDDPASGVGVDYSGDFVVDGNGGFMTPQAVWPLEPGFLVVGTDGVVTKEHTVFDLTATIDPITDTVSGMATPGDDVGVIAEHPLLGIHNAHVVADPGTGEYVAHVTIDLRDGTYGGILEWDGDGDRTAIHFHLHSPDDYDFDSVDNASDNCPYVVNFDQADGDEDGVGDVCDSVHFSDTNGHWAVDSIEVVYANGITTGCRTDPLAFCPEDDVTRAELTAFILRAIDEDGDLPPYQGAFPDVSDGMWYTGYVEKASELGLVTGFIDGNFGPLEKLTRAQMATVVIRALGEPNPPVPPTDPFLDVPRESWFGPYVGRLKALGITVGYADGTYRPHDNITRAEVAAVIERAWNLTNP